MTLVSVIIPTYRDWPRLSKCLDALSTQTLSIRHFEIIVVNNDPASTPPDSLVMPKNCTLIVEPRPGSYAARNAGMRVARGAIYAFTDSDCIPSEDWLETAVLRLRSGARRIAGRIEIFHETMYPTLAGMYDAAYAFNQPFNAQCGASVTANMIAWADCFDLIGDFDDRLMSGGDMEWGWRARDAGVPITYASDVVVAHPARKSLAALLRKKRRTAIGRAFLEHDGRGRESVAKVLMEAAVPPVRAFRRSLQDKSLSFWTCLIAAHVRYLLRLVGGAYTAAAILGWIKPKRC